jgi:hypothetical protein
MENNDNKLQEQQAPLKNHDDAFVQVGKNGEPVIPQEEVEKEGSQTRDDRTTTLDKR